MSDYIGTDLELIRVTVKTPDGWMHSYTTVAADIPVLKGNPFCTEIMSEETGEVFYYV